MKELIIKTSDSRSLINVLNSQNIDHQIITREIILDTEWNENEWRQAAKAESQDVERQEEIKAWDK